MATTRAQSFYNQYDIRRYVDESNFAVIMDTANAKYNGAAWRKLANWDTPSDSRTWSQGHKTVPIMARASLLSTHGLKPMRNTSGWKFYTGSTPKFGHGYTMGEDDMFLLRDARNNTGATMQALIYDSLLTNAQTILGGMHNELSHMCYELASTGEIHEQSVDGVAYDFTFDFEANQFQTVAPAWFKHPESSQVKSTSFLFRNSSCWSRQVILENIFHISSLLATPFFMTESVPHFLQKTGIASEINTSDAPR